MKQYSTTHRMKTDNPLTLYCSVYASVMYRVLGSVKNYTFLQIEKNTGSLVRSSTINSLVQEGRSLINASFEIEAQAEALLA